MSENKCENCKFCNEYHADKFECRRYPPQLLMDGVNQETRLNYFPDVDADCQCGEWRKRDD